jgi:60 kDa SS-A/Ro ribonucleoprotein
MKTTYADVLRGTATPSLLVPPIQPNIIQSTPPTMPIPNKEMVPNRGGGYGFVIDPKTLIQRIIILGTNKGYYTSAAQNTTEAIDSVKKLITEGHGQMIVDIVKDVYEKGRAAKQDPTFVVLGLLCTNENLELRRASWEIIKNIRTFSHLCTFLKYYMAANGGWGRLPKRTLAEWVASHTGHDLLYQTFKYLNRDGWNFRDLLRCVHPTASELSKELQMALKMMILYSKKDLDSASAFDQAIQFGQENNVEVTHIDYLTSIKFLKTCKEDSENVISEIIELVHQHSFTHEFIPSWALSHKEIWIALLMNREKTHVKMPFTALIRNLATMTVKGVFGDEMIVTTLCNHITNKEVIKKSMIHPATIAIAWKQYGSGKGDKGKQTWIPNHEICNALEIAIENAFANIQKTGKKIYHCFDGSSSMTNPMGIVGNMTSAEAVGLLGLCCSRSEDPTTQHYCIFSSNSGHHYGHADGLHPVVFSPNTKLADVANLTQLTNWGFTDCSLPIEIKINEFKTKFNTFSEIDKKAFQTALMTGDTSMRDTTLNALGLYLPDMFIIYTDNDVNSGKRHPSQALLEYRQITGIQAKMAVVATQASNVSIADPNDAHMMDFDGFDSQLPQLLHDFVTGDL